METLKSRYSAISKVAITGDKMSLVYDLVCLKRKLHKKIFAVYLRSCLQHLGQGTQIDPCFHFENPEKIYIGDEVEIRRGVVMLGRSAQKAGIYLDKGVHIKEYAYLDAYGGSIICGEGVRIGHHAVIAGHGGIKFGKWSGIAGLSYVIAANHQFKDLTKPFVYQPETKKGITIGENVWAGCGVIILDGVTIGDHAVIGAGSVIRRNVEPYSIVLGNPARVAYSFKPDIHK